MNENRAILTAFLRDRHSDLSTALATIVHVSGSSYRRPGAKMLINENGDISGSVSGGCLERDLILRALQAIDRSEPQLVLYDTRIDREDDRSEFLVQSAGPGCEGVIKIFINPFPGKHLESMERAHREMQSIQFPIGLPDGTGFIDFLDPPVSLMIFGGGQDAVPVAKLASEIGWDVTIINCRSSFPAPRRLFGEVTEFITCEPQQVIERIGLGPWSIGFLMTHNYTHDLTILKQIITRPVKYLGILGPRTRTERILSELKKENIPIPMERIHFPMGLDIGGDSPQSIALSALAEAQAVLNGRKGGFLADRSGPIHG